MNIGGAQYYTGLNPAERHFEALKRILDRQEPDYASGLEVGPCGSEGTAPSEKHTTLSHAWLRLSPLAVDPVEKDSVLCLGISIREARTRGCCSMPRPASIRHSGCSYS